MKACEIEGESARSFCYYCAKVVLCITVIDGYSRLLTLIGMTIGKLTYVVFFNLFIAKAASLPF